MSTAFAEYSNGYGARPNETYERARARRLCARALVLALDPAVEISAAADKLAALAADDVRSVLRALAFVRLAAERPSPVNERAGTLLLRTLRVLTRGRDVTDAHVRAHRDGRGGHSAEAP
jgi:hypothetical protein